MKYLSKCAIITLSFVAMSLQSTIVAASNKTDDPCNELTGQWQGEWNNTYNNCRWKINIDAVTYKERAQFVVQFTNGGKGCLENHSATISGSCIDGQLDLTLHNFANMDEYRMTGRVYGKILTMEDERRWRNVHAYKVS